MARKNSEYYFKRIAKRLNRSFQKVRKSLSDQEGEVTIQTKQVRDGRIELHDLKELCFKFANRQDLKKSYAIPAEAWSDYYMRVAQNAKSIVIVVTKEQIFENPSDDAFVRIKSRPLRERRISSKRYKLCDRTKFIDQRSIHPSGSGFFIKEGIIATASHLIIDALIDTADIRFIHGIVVNEKSSKSDQIIVPKSAVYEVDGESELYHEHSKYADWALVKVKPSYEDYQVESPDLLPQPVTLKDRAPKKIRSRRPKEKLYAIGHGLGLPMKVSYDGEIFKVNRKFHFFECSLTLLGGNSGSPVFYADTHELAGIYMRGTNKFFTSDCELCKHMEKESPCVKVDNRVSKYEGQECQMLGPIREQLNLMKT